MFKALSNMGRNIVEIADELVIRPIRVVVEPIKQVNDFNMKNIKEVLGDEDENAAN
jgi:hypothetical protein